MKTVPKSDFKPKSFEYFRSVETTGEEIIITDHGKPVLKISKITDLDEEILESLRHSVVRYENPTEPVAVGDWEAGS